MRPIDADALASKLRDKSDELIPLEEGSRGNASIFYTGVKVGLQNAAIVADDFPTIDAVPVTRCRDCKHRKAKMGDCYGNGLVLCNDGVWRDMEFFCADGERSEDADC